VAGTFAERGDQGDRLGEDSSHSPSLRKPAMLACRGRGCSSAPRPEALQDALDRFEGTVLAVRHDRWFARSFDRFLVFGSDGCVYESDEPIWDEARVIRSRRSAPADPLPIDS